MTSSFVDALIFIVTQLASLYLLILLVRLMLPWMGVNFQNPLTQAVLKATSPLVVPIRRLVPPIGKLDSATIIVAVGIKYLVNWLTAILRGAELRLLQLLALSAVELLQLLLLMFTIAVFLRVLCSWFWPNSFHPLIGLLNSFTEPVMRPFRRYIPPFGPIDLSPIFALIALGALSILAAGLYQSVSGW